MIKVSVVIPIYNVETYIEECLLSAMNQTLKDIEIICVNDGSLDNSMKIVEKYAQIDKRIVLVEKENGGLSSARNAGLKVANGEYIYFLDSDDYILENTLEYLYTEMNEQRLDTIFFDADSFYENEELSEKHSSYKDTYHRSEIYSEIVSGTEMIEKMAINDDFKPSACLQMNRTSLLRENHISFKEGIIHEDNLFTIQICIRAERVKHIAKCFYQRRLRDNSIMTARTAYGSNYGYLQCMEGTIEEILGHDTEDIYRVYMTQLRRMRDVASGMLKKLPQQELEDLLIGDTVKQKLMFELVIKDYAKLLQKKDKRIRELKKKVEKLEDEKQQLQEQLEETNNRKWTDLLFRRNK